MLLDYYLRSEDLVYKYVVLKLEAAFSCFLHSIQEFDGTPKYDERLLAK